MWENNAYVFQCSIPDADQTALPAWIYDTNEIVADILEDLEDFDDKGDLGRILFDMALERDLNDLIAQCPVDPFSLIIECESTNPYLKIFINSLEDEIIDQNVNYFQQVDIKLLLQKIRNNLYNNDEFYKALEHLEKNKEATSNSLFQYFHDLKKENKKLMIIRLDLYTNNFKNIVQDWQRIKKFVFEKFEGKAVGYAVKFEYGRQRGVHMHTLLFFNGNKVCRDVKIAKIIGDHWKNIVTKGVGTYSNCNTLEHKKNMRYPAVGVFRDFDEATLKGVRHIANYLTHSDLVVRFAVPSLVQTFRKGESERVRNLRNERRLQRKATC